MPKLAPDSKESYNVYRGPVMHTEQTPNNRYDGMDIEAKSFDKRGKSIDL